MLVHQMIVDSYLHPSDSGSRHSQAEHDWVFTLSPQQSPPSHSHPQLLFSSSHQLSPFHWGEPQLPAHAGVVVVIVVVVVVVDRVDIVGLVIGVIP